MRTDITIVGSSAPNEPANDCDLTLNSLSTTVITNQLRPNSGAPRPTLKKNIDTIIQLILDIRAVTKNHKYEGKTKHSFAALVFSSCGTLHSSVETWFSALRKRGLNMSYLTKDISVILLRSRAVGFLFDYTFYFKD